MHAARMQGTHALTTNVSVTTNLAEEVAPSGAAQGMTPGPSTTGTEVVSLV
jgi:hypothetical protein